MRSFETCPEVNEDTHEKLIVDIRSELEKFRQNVQHGVAAESQVIDMVKQKNLLDMITKQNNEYDARLKKSDEYFQQHLKSK